MKYITFELASNKMFLSKSFFLLWFYFFLVRNISFCQVSLQLFHPKKRNDRCSNLYECMNVWIHIWEMYTYVHVSHKCQPGVLRWSCPLLPQFFLCTQNQGNSSNLPEGFIFLIGFLVLLIRISWRCSGFLRIP